MTSSRLVGARRRRGAVVAGLALGLLAAACADDDAPADGAVDGATSADAWIVRDVVDGDTIVVERDGQEERVRLIGINTPETGECLADEAADRLAELVDDEPVRLVRDTSDTDDFDRLLRYVETTDGTDVGGVLVADGLAIARRFEPDVARAPVYERLQADARSTAIGLWAPDACGPATVGAGSIVVTVTADPPGDDTDDLTGEWVEFANVGGEAIELDGFVVADESASNRYEFGSVTLAAGGTVRLVTGCGADTSTGTRTTVYWCSDGSAVWNNSGDTVFLRDRSGNLVVALTYHGS